MGGSEGVLKINYYYLNKKSNKISIKKIVKKMEYGEGF